jgi:hypothetical protein
MSTDDTQAIEANLGRAQILASQTAGRIAGAIERATCGECGLIDGEPQQVNSTLPARLGKEMHAFVATPIAGKIAVAFPFGTRGQI